jgi:protein subunit release factor A
MKDKEIINEVGIPIVEGIIAVANHKLRLEGVESYRDFISSKIYTQEELEEALKLKEEEFKKKLERLKKNIPDLVFAKSETEDSNIYWEINEIFGDLKESKEE